MEELERKIVGSNGGPQCQKYGMLGGQITFNRVKFATVRIEQAQPLPGRNVAFIGEVVGTSGKVVNRRNGRPQSPWEQD